MIREGFEVEFECGHKMIYDRHGLAGIPELGERGFCRQEGEWGEPKMVVGLRQCWIETTTTIHFEKPVTA